ncbi:ACT domain-containing protein [Yoonia sp.]|uniref:ACT domain-containing protein n=1 Tax=Yoonia sp. TaxID=2212373 RepID=UPI002FD8AA32
MISGEGDLATLLRRLSATLTPETYDFATLDSLPPGITPRMVFVEDEGKTPICTRAEAEAAGIPHSFPCRMITCNVHSALKAVSPALAGFVVSRTDGAARVCGKKRGPQSP